MHINAAAEEVEIRNLHSTIDPKTGMRALTLVVVCAAADQKVDEGITHSFRFCRFFSGEKVEKGKARPRFIKQGNIADVEVGAGTSRFFDGGLFDVVFLPKSSVLFFPPFCYPPPVRDLRGRHLHRSF